MLPLKTNSCVYKSPRLTHEAGTFFGLRGCVNRVSKQAP